MTPITISLFRGTNSLFLECGTRTAYIDISPDAAAKLVQLLESWTERGHATPAEARLPPEEVARMVEDWNAKHKDDLDLADLDLTEPDLTELDL